MSVVSFENLRVELLPGESVLEGLERVGQCIPNSCRSGVCQSCVMQAVEGELPPLSQRGIKDAWTLQGYFLACQCRPHDDLRVALPSQAIPSFTVQVLSKQIVADDIVVLQFDVPPGFACRSGQYVHLEVNQLLRSYSVASVPERDGYIELHIRRVRGGRVSGWLHDHLEIGDECVLKGPLGDCFYIPDEAQEFPILLAGTGTGLAPLEGIARDALGRGHRGPITLIHGAGDRRRLYHAEKLQRLAGEHPNFTYLPTVRDEGGEGHVPDALKNWLMHYGPSNTRVFLCGAPELVHSMKRQAFLLGAASRHIYADPFVLAPPPGAPDAKSL